jgi:FkbM family methyltransferase
MTKTPFNKFLRGVKNLVYPNRVIARFRTSSTAITHEDIAALIGETEPTILEIGCNDGTDTLKFLRVLPQASIYCFEPDPRAIEKFKNKLGPEIERVKLFECAISSQNGQIQFHQSTGGDLHKHPHGWDLSGSIRQPKHHLKIHPSISFEDSISVNTCTLDDWSAENGIDQIDFIWMDVQGAEGDVIAGAQSILEKTRFLYTEYSNDELYEGQLSLKDLLSRLPSFDVVTRYPGDVLLRNRKLAS